MTDSKHCPKCDLTKPLVEFYPRKGGYRSWCKTCDRSNRPERTEEFKAKEKCRTLRRRYGISLAEFTALLESQSSCCAICSTDQEPKQGWHTDHDHTTGKVRGILCHNCNLLLGLGRDRPAILQSAIDYLHEHS
jgi:hypothetical protein